MIFFAEGALVDMETITRWTKCDSCKFVNMPEVSIANRFSMNMSKKICKTFQAQITDQQCRFCKKWLVSIFTFKAQTMLYYLEPAPMIAWFWRIVHQNHNCGYWECPLSIPHFAILFVHIENRRKRLDRQILRQVWLLTWLCIIYKALLTARNNETLLLHRGLLTSRGWSGPGEGTSCCCSCLISDYLLI